MNFNVYELSFKIYYLSNLIVRVMEIRNVIPVRTYDTGYIWLCYENFLIPPLVCSTVQEYVAEIRAFGFDRPLDEIWCKDAGLDCDWEMATATTR